ncbi:MAG: cyclase family protein [Gammaproteobacteria bacterium]
MNNISQHSVRAAGSLIRTGKVYSLAIPTGVDSVAYGARQYRLHVAPIYVGDAATYGSNRLQGYDDIIISHLGVGTQIDGFAHVALDGRHYNGVATSAVIRPHGAIRYGIETLPPIVGRGVLLDLSSVRSNAPARAVFNRAELEAAMARQGVTVGQGDIVLLHTGNLQATAQGYVQRLDTVPGLGLEGARFLADRGVSAIGMDAWIPDALPAEDESAFLPVHGLLLVERGVFILENVRTAELAADQAWEFFFVLAAPRFEGAVQSVVHPVAIR